MIKEVREVTDKEFELPTEGNNVADQPAENVTSSESVEQSAAAIADSFKQDDKTIVEPTAESIAETIADINSDAAVAVSAMPTKAPKKEKKKKRRQIKIHKSFMYMSLMEIGIYIRKADILFRNYLTLNK